MIRFDAGAMDHEARRLPLADVIAAEGFDDLHDALADWGWDSVVPSLCSLGCRVEQDGWCPHGYPSVVQTALF